MKTNTDIDHRNDFRKLTSKRKNETEDNPKKSVKIEAQSSQKSAVRKSDSTCQLRQTPKAMMRKTLDNFDRLPSFFARKEAFKKEVCRNNSLFSNKCAVEEYKTITRQSPLIMATVFDDLECAQALLKLGVNVDDKYDGGSTALHSAICSDNFKVARYLIKQGANMDTPCYGGATPRDAAKMLPELSEARAKFNDDEIAIRKLAMGESSC